MAISEDSHSGFRIGVDTGGTFTDVAGLVEGRLEAWKLPSTPAAFEEAVLEGALIVSAGRTAQLIHSTTVATNALLERKGARAALVTTAGFRDVLEIGRQNRPELYALFPRRNPPLIPRERRFEVEERVSAEGEILQPLDPACFPALLRELQRVKAESVAVVFLFSFLRPEHERMLGAFLREAGFRVSLSHEILPEFREYERSSTTVINAFVQPAMAAYLERLQTRARPQKLENLHIMQSNGGTLTPSRAGELAVNTLLSGPAAGLKGAMALAAASDLLPDLRLITFDMGGTSTDVSLLDGQICLSSELKLEGFPVGVPMVDVHTVGAGGGSVARIDSGGALQVGPESAGAVPGPAAYGRGGPATVTDAHVVKGNLRAENFLQGRMTLDAEASRRVMEALGKEMGGRSAEAAAEGVLRLVNVHMENAIRVISVQRGYDPADFTLMGFGGAGGLHVFALAEALNMPRVMVPCHPGVLSALGAALSPLRREAGRTLMRRWEPEIQEDLETEIAGLRKQLSLEMQSAGELRFRISLDMRYVGQSHELRVELAAEDLGRGDQCFHELHRQRYGHAEPSAAVELVTLRVEAEGPEPRCELPELDAEGDGREIQGEVVVRSRLRRGDRCRGPALLVEDFHTVCLPAGWQLEVDRVGNLLGTRTGERL